MPFVPIEEYKPKEKKDTKFIPVEEYKSKFVPLEQSSSPQKLSESELKENPEWIRAAKNIYEWNEGRNSEEVKKLNSDKQYADYALRYMGWFNYNIPKMGKEVSDLKFNANQQQREDFVTLMDMYDNKEASLAGTGRFIKGVGSDITTYLGIGAYGTGLLARQAAKASAKKGIKELVKQGAKQGAKIGAAEGALYSTVDNTLRQSARVMSGQQEGFELGQSVKAAGLGAGLGGILGGSIGGGASYFKNKNKVPVQVNEMVGPTDMVGPRVDVPQPKVDTPVTPEVVTPKVETAKPKSTKIPEILKIPKKPKVRTAKSYIEGGAISRDFSRMGELKQILESDKGIITSKYLAPKNSKGFTDFDQIQEAMQEDGFLPELQTFDGEVPDFTNRIIDDLQTDRVHQDDQMLLSNWERQTEEARTIRQTLDDFNIDYKGMSDGDVRQAYSDVINNKIPPVRDEVPLGVYADDIALAEGGNINKVKADDVIDTPDGKDFQTDTTVDLNNRLVEVGVKIMDDLQIPRNPEVKISDQLEEVIFQAEKNPAAREKLEPVLKRNDITFEELSQLFRGSIADSARKMQKLSAVSRAIANLSEKIGKTAKPETWTSKLSSFIKQADNIRRGLLVSQISTAMRNNSAQFGRVGMHTLIDLFDNTLKQTFNPVRKAFGAEEAPVNYARSFELILNLTKNKKQAKDLTDLLTKHYVNDAENLYTRYSSDVTDASQTTNSARVLKVGQKVTDGLNVFNRMQDYWYRRAIFANTITDVLLKKGIDINEAGISDDLLKYVNKADIEKAVDDALYFTYSKTPEIPIVKGLVDVVNKAPFLLTGVIPFPRFIANALAFQFKHSPAGFASLLTPGEIAKLKAGDYKTLSQAVVGTTLLLTAVEMKRKGSEDHKWYEVETSSGKTVDMRPYFPLTPYLLVADMIVRNESGRGGPDAKDVLQGLTGAQFRAGASIQLVQNVIDGMSELDTEEKINKFFSDYTSNVLGGYLTPVRMFGDFIDAGRFYLDEDFEGQKFRRPVPTGEFLTDTANQLKTNIPFVKEQFPESESPTREANPGRPDTVQIPFTGIDAPGPLVRQLTGATVREEKNAAEREFDRLGFKRRDILPYSGNAIVDQTRAEYMGKPVEIIVGALVESPIYKSKTNAEKDALLRKTLQQIRKSANDYIKANKINEEAFQKAAFNRQPKYMKKLLAEKGITWKTFNDKSNGENR